MEASQEGWRACAKDRPAATDAILAGNLRDLRDKHTRVCDKHCFLDKNTRLRDKYTQIRNVCTVFTLKYSL